MMICSSQNINLLEHGFLRNIITNNNKNNFKVDVIIILRKPLLLFHLFHGFILIKRNFLLINHLI